MKLLILTFIFLPIFCFTQVTGDITKDKRKLTKEFAFEIEGNTTGVLTFDIAVNEAGDVTGCQLNRAECTIYSTPLVIRQKNRILSELKFEPGNQYPKFHQGKIQITIIDTP